MSRREFTKPVKRLALARSGGRCEALGGWYGLAEDQRCNAPLSHGVQFDHIILDANSKDNSLENCAAVCVACHKFKTAFHDIPTAAKTVRQQDRALGIIKAKGRIKSAGFPSKRPRTVPQLPRLPATLNPLWRGRVGELMKPIGASDDHD